MFALVIAHYMTKIFTKNRKSGKGTLFALGTVANAVEIILLWLSPLLAQTTEQQSKQQAPAHVLTHAHIILKGLGTRLVSRNAPPNFCAILFATEVGVSDVKTTMREKKSNEVKRVLQSALLPFY